MNPYSRQPGMPPVPQPGYGPGQQDGEQPAEAPGYPGQVPPGAQPPYTAQPGFPAQPGYPGQAGYPQAGYPPQPGQGPGAAPGYGPAQGPASAVAGGHPAMPGYAPAPGSGYAPTAGYPGQQPSSGGPRGLRRILFTSQKGGVGKTASAVNVAAALGQMGARVLLVDTDPIGSVAACFGTLIAQGHPGLFGVEQWDVSDLVIPEVAPSLDLMPYAQDGRPIDLNALHRSLETLGQRVGNSYDFVIVDTRPSVADITRRLCQVVDEVVVVFQCHPLAYRTLGGVLGQLRDARSDGANAQLLGLLLTMVDPGDPMQGQLEGHIRGSLGQALFPISIPKDDFVTEGLLQDRPVVLHRPDSPSAWAYRQIASYVAMTRPAARGTR